MKLYRLSPLARDEFDTLDRRAARLDRRITRLALANHLNPSAEGERRRAELDRRLSRLLRRIGFLA